MGSGSLLKIILCTLWLDDQKCISDTFRLEVRCTTVQVNYNYKSKLLIAVNDDL